MNNHDEFQEIRELLAARKNVLPSDDYFASIVDEFHQHQMVGLLKKQSRWKTWLSIISEWFSESTFSPLRAPIAVPTLAAFALLLAVNTTSIPSTSAPLLTLQVEKAAYAFTEGLQSSLPSHEAIEVAFQELDPSKEMPYYVLAETPSHYDNTMAF